MPSAVSSNEMRTLQAIHRYGPPSHDELARHHTGRELERMQRTTRITRITTQPGLRYYILGRHGRTALTLNPDGRPPGPSAIAQQRARGHVTRYLEDQGHTLERHDSTHSSIFITPTGGHLHAFTNHAGDHRRSFTKRLHEKLLNLILLPNTSVAVFDPNPEHLQRLAREHARFISIQPIPTPPPPWRPTRE